MPGLVDYIGLVDDSFLNCDLRGDEAMATHTDPVCGMKVDDEKAGSQSTYEGTTYHFCSQGCKAKFDKDPHQYASQNAGS